MRVTVDKNWRVKGESSLRIDLPASALWGQVRDWRRFLLIDPLHERLDDIVPSKGSATPKGTRFLIRHRFLGVGPTRRGRVLSWQEGRGLAISDLSRRGDSKGFPHVCQYRVESCESGSRLSLGVRGVWTARWIPRPIVRLWLGWVLVSTEACLLRELAALSAWQRSRSTFHSNAAKKHPHEFPRAGVKLIQLDSSEFARS